MTLILPISSSKSVRRLREILLPPSHNFDINYAFLEYDVEEGIMVGADLKHKNQ